MKTYRVTGGKAPLILNLGSRWGSVGSLMSWAIYPPGRAPR